MVKIILAGLWVCGVLTGSAYYFAAAQSSHSNPTQETGSPFGGLDYVTLEPMTIAIVRDNEVKGYLILETVFTVKQSLISNTLVPLPLILRDTIIASVHANPEIDIFRIERFELDEFREQILNNINARLGEKVIYDILVQRVDFISKDDVRDLQLRRS